MATLNTLRTRGGVILSVVIGIALLAFLLGDFSTSGSNMLNERKMMVGKINGERVGYTAFTNKVDYYTNVVETMSNSNNLTTEQQDNIRNQAWDAFIMENAWMPGFAEAGLKVGEEEQLDMVTGNFISPIIRQSFSDPNTGAFDPNAVRTFVSRAGQDPKAQMIWNFFKEQMLRERLFQKYATLVKQGLYVTNLEVEQGVAYDSDSSSINYIVKDYSTLSDSTINIAQAEIQKYYDAHQKLFRQSASRDIEYVLFEVLPSDADNAEAEKAVGTMAGEFAASENPMQYATLNSQEQPDKEYYAADQLPAELSAFAFGADHAGMYGPAKEGDLYTMARVTDTRMVPDSLGARHILLKADQKSTADSIITALKAGASFAELSNTYSLDKAAAAKGGDLGIFNPAQMVPEFSDAALKAKVNDYFTVETQYGLHVGQVTFASAPKQKVQLAKITYRVEPSEATQHGVYSKVSKFMGEAAGSYDNFEKATTSNSLQKRVVRIRNTDRNINGIENSREVVRWAYNGKKGDISSIMEVNGNYLIAAITGVAEDGIAPLSDVTSQIKAQLILKKKGELIANEMRGASLSAVSAKLGLEQKSASGIDFGAYYIDGIGRELKLIGAVSAAKPMTLSKPVAGEAGVYLFEVTGREKIDSMTPEKEKETLKANAQAYLAERINQVLAAETETIDNRAKFF